MAVQTAPIAAGSLVAAYLVARETRVRALGGLVLGAASVYLGRRWSREAGAAVAGALLATHLAAFGVSHPLAKRIGAWPSVFAVATVSGCASNLLADRPPPRSTRLLGPPRG